MQKNETVNTQIRIFFTILYLSKKVTEFNEKKNNLRLGMCCRQLKIESHSKRNN